MNRGLAAGLIVLAVVAVTGLLFYAVVTGAKPSASDFTASGVSSAPSVSESPASPSSPTASPAPSADPCHRGGVTYCALNSAVTEATIRTTICVSGWTATVRPPESYTEPLKLQQMASEGLGGSASDYEEDHRMPLELGGDPRDVTNLSPESHAQSYTKDSAENAARREVCDGADLRTVQIAFVATWLGPYPTYAR